MLGIWMKILSVMCFVIMYSFLKSASGVPAGELSFFRAFFGLIPIFIWVIFTKELRGVFYTRHLLGHIFRGMVGTFAMFFSFYALTLLPLPETIAINYGEPLILTILSALFLGEKIRAYRWSAVTIGLVGVLIILWPRLTVFGSDKVDIGASIGALSALCAAFMAAIAMLLVRKLVFTEKTATIALYFMITSSVLSLITLPFGWVWPDFYQSLMLISAGIFGGIAQIFMTQSYRYAEASIVAPFEYSSIILALLTGYVFFHEIPTFTMLFGANLVIGAGIFIILRESYLSRLRGQ
ncbi:DMT family transporter [Bartonella tamiae]|uniref:EamA domain-containing protein n=1 Tax=Bartonella tamiae Th239 TaxID=1094558 RepID=J0ZPR8_9HYPH|nr:DMT family transporter [Bartonella tamiae]EJF90593.1 hypothetical protein ME5_00994 [Bartonella tamiae Th239]EJF94029.1 hypothetical protein MEG_00887 [Bartonella tamiae Th307]